MDVISEELILRYLQNECSAEEAKAVEDWELQSEENRKLLEQMYFILQSADRLQAMDDASPEKALAALKKKIGSRSFVHRLRRIATLTQRVAAILFIPILLFSGYYFMRDYNEPTQYIEVKTNSGMVSTFDLPDGSKVWLNSGGTLKYPVRFDSGKREVKLSGQGYFDVKRDKSKPFFVRVDDFYSVEVLGTEFNMTAYEDDNTIETTLVSGKIKLSIKLADGRLIQKVLNPNQKATYGRDTRKLTIATVNPEYDSVWKEGKMVFRQHSMEHIIKVLSRHYNVRFEVTNPKVLQSEITAKFTNEPLQQVLEYIRLASDIQYKFKHPAQIEDDTLRVSVIELSK